MPRTLTSRDIPRELRPHFKEMTRQGWKFRKNGHIVATSPSGKVVSISSTPSSPRFLKEVVRDLRHAGLDFSSL
jgi:hypothetical protein